MSDAVAILVFARPAADDAARKRFVSSAYTNRRVLARLTEHVMRVATGTGLPVLHSTDLITHQGSFGDQLSAALQAVFDLGHERVLVVGNDCPGLTPPMLLGAADALRSAAVVLGPDRRGGLYLLGISRPVFDANRLAQLPWQTPALSRITRHLFASCAVVELVRLSDVNQLTDLQAYRTTNTGVGVFVHALLALIRLPFKAGYTLTRQPPTAVFWPGSGLLRGPPVA